MLSSIVSITLGASMSESYYNSSFKNAINNDKDNGEIFIDSEFNTQFVGLFNDQLAFLLFLNDYGAFNVAVVDVELYDFANNVTVLQATEETTEETVGETTETVTETTTETTPTATSSSTITTTTNTGSSSTKSNAYTSTWENVAIVTLCACLGIGFGLTFFSLVCYDLY